MQLFTEHLGLPCSDSITNRVSKIINERDAAHKVRCPLSSLKEPESWSKLAYSS